jgi:hypothetical protein
MLDIFQTALGGVRWSRCVLLAARSSKRPAQQFGKTQKLIGLLSASPKGGQQWLTFTTSTAGIGNRDLVGDDSRKPPSSTPSNPKKTTERSEKRHGQKD